MIFDFEVRILHTNEIFIRNSDKEIGKNLVGKAVELPNRNTEPRAAGSLIYPCALIDTTNVANKIRPIDSLGLIFKFLFFFL
jgi:hypothetical protein